MSAVPIASHPDTALAEHAAQAAPQTRVGPLADLAGSAHTRRLCAPAPHWRGTALPLRPSPSPTPAAATLVHAV